MAREGMTVVGVVLSLVLAALVAFGLCHLREQMSARPAPSALMR